MSTGRKLVTLQPMSRVTLCHDPHSRVLLALQTCTLNLYFKLVPRTDLRSNPVPWIRPLLLTCTSRSSTLYHPSPTGRQPQLGMRSGPPSSESLPDPLTRMLSNTRSIRACSDVATVPCIGAAMRGARLVDCGSSNNSGGGYPLPPWNDNGRQCAGEGLPGYEIFKVAAQLLVDVEGNLTDERCEMRDAGCLSTAHGFTWRYLILLGCHLSVAPPPSISSVKPRRRPVSRLQNHSLPASLITPAPKPTGDYNGPLVAGKGGIPSMRKRKAVKATVCTDFRPEGQGLQAFADSTYSLTW